VRAAEAEARSQVRQRWLAGVLVVVALLWAALIWM
jgi:hypothetical protein